MTTSTDNLIWPVAKFHFQVEWDDHLLTFQEVSGLDAENEAVEYRAGNEPRFSAISMPGMEKNSDVTLNKGSFVSDNNFWGWYDHMRIQHAKTSMVIKLIDESGEPTMTWTLANAWPKQITGSDLEANGDQVAIESIVITHEGLTIQAM